MIGKPYRRVEKDWGHELWLANGPAYCGKVLVIAPEAQTSWHYHQRKVETLFLAEGGALVYLPGPDGKPMPHVMETGDLVTIQPYQPHGFASYGTSVVLFEVSSQHFEDDSVRVYAGGTYGPA